MPVKPRARFDSDIAAIVGASHRDPFSYLGLHPAGDGRGLVLRAFLPGADTVSAFDVETGQTVAELERVHEDGLFAGRIEGGRANGFPYRLRVRTGSDVREMDDPYRFPPVLGEQDAWYLAEGNHLDSYRKLGAHPIEMEGVAGVSFAVWAPNASRVGVVGDFNGWDGRRHPMRLHPSCGVWEIFIPGLGRGAVYKYEIKDAAGRLLPLKSDPYAFRAEPASPHTASVVEGLGRYGWGDGNWMAGRGVDWRRRPVSIYEVHLGSWRRDHGGAPSYTVLADSLIPYVAEMGFTHIELLPVSEYPFDGSWGYQPVSLFAPTARFGGPDEFRAFVDRCHQAGIGVILDWVAAHFPEDAHGLAWFDGTHLYEHADPREGRHMDWGTLIYNYGRNEVANFLLSNAGYWLDEFHIDALRVDAVASMLYRDYSRPEGGWIPNRHGGRENLEAMAFLKRLNEVAYARSAGIFTVAEESTAWPGVSTPTWAGGLGFGFKWNMGWMHDTLRYMQREPVHRRFHQDDLTFGLLYAFTENFILPLSHDEVVHGKGSILARMPGDDWQRFANLRLYYSFMFTYPGKKLLFMGAEFAQAHEWNFREGLDWGAAEGARNAGVSRLVRDLNRLYRETPALHERDCEPDGFTWIDCDDAENSMLSYMRSGADSEVPVVVICNFTPVPRRGCRVGVPLPGRYEEVLNSDSHAYGGGNIGNLGGAEARREPHHGRPWSLTLNVPPLGVVVLRRRAAPGP